MARSGLWLLASRQVWLNTNLICNASFSIPSSAANACSITLVPVDESIHTIPTIQCVSVHKQTPRQPHQHMVGCIPPPPLCRVWLRAAPDSLSVFCAAGGRWLKHKGRRQQQAGLPGGGPTTVVFANGCQASPIWTVTGAHPAPPGTLAPVSGLWQPHSPCTVI
jgi:hypothetical protein